MISFSIFQIANQQYCISFQLSHNLFTAARRQDPLGNPPNLCNVSFYYIFHLATADRCDKIARSWVTPPTRPIQAVPIAIQKKHCKLFHTQFKLFQVNLHLKFSLQRHLYFSMYHRAVLNWFYLGSKQHFSLEIIQHWKEVQRLRNSLVSEIVMWRETLIIETNSCYHFKQVPKIRESDQVLSQLWKSSLFLI